MTTTTTQQEVCAEIKTLLREKLYHPHRQGRELDELLTEFDTECPLPTSPDAFEPSVNKALKKLNGSFWRGAGQNLPAQFGINATLQQFDDQWVFTNVFEGGLAQGAGIQAGEGLLAVDQQPLSKREPSFALGRTFELSVLNRDGRTKRTVSISLPAVGPKNRPPMIEPTPVVTSVRGHVGLLKVAAFPGIIGFDFARSISSAVKRFQSQDCNRLLVDLRGNCGGGLGFLRLISYFTPDKVPVGYSLTRAARDAQRRPEQLTVIDRIPNSKLALYAMALKFRFFEKDRSLRLVTEGLGTQPFHGRIVVLIDEYTRSGAEMVAAFAQERGLARLVGSKTPGQTLGAANFIVGSEYRLRIPLVGWYTAQDEMLEGRGVRPDVEVRPTLEDLRSGADKVLSVGTELVESL